MPSAIPPVPETFQGNIGALEAWPDNVKLYQQFEVEQILLAEQANCLSVQAFLKMCGLNFEIEMRSNAEHMSPNGGKLPFIKCGTALVAELEPIVEFVQRRGTTLTDHLNSEQKADLKAYMSLITVVLHNAELYLNWVHDKTFKEVTKPRYSICYPWPLDHILTWKKRKMVLSKLKTFDWANNTVEDVLEKVNDCCQSLSTRLGSQDYFFGEKPTELDALVFGHLFTILTTLLPDINLGNVIRRYQNLIDLCRRIDAAHFQKHSSD